MTGVPPLLVTVAAAVIGLLVAGGLWAIVAGARGVEEPSGARRAVRWPAIVDRWMAVGMLAGVLATALTGWLIWLVILPVLVAALPRLLAAEPDPEVELLAALDRWVRTLTATLGTGRSVVDAVRGSAASAPPLLAPAVQRLTHRLDERWAPSEALRAMADELDSPAADAVVAALLLAAERGGTGITASMRELSDSVQRRLAALREITAERARPRIVIRQVSVVMAVVIAAATVLGGEFFAPYGTPVGQVILAALVGCYLLTLVMVRRLSAGRRRTRILQGAA